MGAEPLSSRLERQEDLVFTCRVLAQAAKLPGLEAGSVRLRLGLNEQTTPKVPNRRHLVGLTSASFP